MKCFKRYLLYLKDILILIPYYNIALIISLFKAWVISIGFSIKASCRSYEFRKNEIILHWLNTRYGKIVPEIITTPRKSDEPERIFVFWYQGINGETPELIKMCIESVRRNAGGRDVVIVTKDNMRQWADIPEYIYKQVETGAITITHLSDILRLCLLYQHGGFWIDATVYLKSPLTSEKLNPLFSSIKIKDRNTGTISAYRWTSFFLYAEKSSMAIKAFRDILFAYWKKCYGRIIDYLLIDFTFEMLYRKCSIFKNIIDNAPYSNESLYTLNAHLEDTLDKECFFQSTKDTFVFKLQRRKKYRKEINGIPTIYGQLLRNND